MAIYKGPLPISGKVGNLIFYEVDGKIRVRSVGKTITGDDFKKRKEFKRARENAKEFGGAARASKSLRQSWVAYGKELKVNKWTGKVNGMMQRILKLSDGEKGKRPIEISQNGSLLIDYELRQDFHLGSTFTGKPKLTVGEGNLYATLDLPAYSLKAPYGATHFKLKLMLSCISDYHYNPESDKYLPIHPDFDGQAAPSESTILPVTNKSPISVSAAFLSLNDPFPEGTSLVTCLGIEYLKYEGGSYYELAESRSMKVIAVNPGDA